MCAVSMSWLQVFVSWISVTLVSSSVLDFIDAQIKTGKYDKRLRPNSGGKTLYIVAKATCFLLLRRRVSVVKKRLHVMIYLLVY